MAVTGIDIDLTLRQTKGSPLTYQELDDNQTELKTGVENHSHDEFIPASNINHLQFNIAPTDIPLEAGTIAWNPTERTLDIDLNGVVLQTGQEIVVNVRNNTASTITNGTVCMATGTIGASGRITVTTMDGTDVDNAMYLLGIATEDIPAGSDGYVTVFGKIRGIDTSDYIDGDILYTSTTVLGGLTKIAPTTGLKQPIAIVINAASNGVLFVRIETLDHNRANFENLTAATAVIGDSSNNSSFTEDGSLVFNGTATVFDDLIGTAMQLKATGVGISINAAENTLEYLTSANLSDYAYDNFQMSHKWKMGSTIYPHIHWIQTQNNTPNWLFQYRWQTNGLAKTTVWTNLICKTNAFPYTSGSLNQISYSAGIIPPVGANLSDIIQFRILRDTTNASTRFTGSDTYTATAGITSSDIHIEIDTIGSKQEYIK